MQKLVLASPALLTQMQLLPAEKMLAAIDPGYDVPEVSSKLDLQINNGSLHVTQYNPDSLTGAAYSEGLSDIFYDCPPVKEFRRRYNLTRVGGKRPFLAALLKAYKQFNGAGKPQIAILEFRNPSGSSEFELFRDFFRKEGFATEIISPEQLEYRKGVLRAGSFEISLIYRRVSVQEFLVKFNLSHPLVKAYRDHKVCVVNSFRSELAQKRSMFALLTDESLTAKFPQAERKAIRDHVPWTRLVKAGVTSHQSGEINLLDFIQEHRETLVLKPNDDSGDDPSFAGAEMDQAGWERAVRQAQRTPYVVQERVKAARFLFPLLNYGHLEFKEMHVDVHPQVYLGKVSGCSSWVSASNATAFSTSAGIAPTFIIDSK
ncbi:MAG: hypothetical protein M3Z09_14885 [Acidobacteriota bacterium]|nr:hypothetical protein [Acidobacteriota bacterium]